MVENLKSRECYDDQIFVKIIVPLFSWNFKNLLFWKPYDFYNVVIISFYDDGKIMFEDEMKQLGFFFKKKVAEYVYFVKRYDFCKILK